MSLAAPERLLAAFIGSAGLLEREAARAAAGPELEAVLQVLRERGHAIEPLASGWRLPCAERHFDPQRFLLALEAGIGRDIEVWETAPSTNDLAHRGAAGGAPHGSTWLAEEQPLGRGRQGRRWECAAHAGLLVSVLLRAPLAADGVPSFLPLALALGACEALRGETGLDVRTKWPNDLVLDGRKLAGLLVEARPGRDAYAVAGLGLNVGAEAAPRALRGQAAWVGSTPRELLLARILAGVERRYEAWRRGEFASLRSAWLGLDTVVGRRVRVRLASETCEGRAETVTESGLLRLALADGTRSDFAAGEVHLA